MNLHTAIAVNNQSLADLALDAPDLYEWQPLTITCTPQPGAVAARLRINDVDLGAPTTTLGDPLWRWQWNPQHAVGVFAALLTVTFGDGTSDSAAFDLRIKPRKIDVERYEALIAAVQRDAFAVVYALSGGREGAALQPTTHDRTLIEEYVTLVEGHAREALEIVAHIAARPQQALQPQHDTVRIGEAERIDPAALGDMLRGPLDDLAEDVLPVLQAALRPADRTRGGPLPRSLPATRTAPSHDLIEHRLLRHVLDVLLWRAGVVRETIRRETERRQRNAALVEGAAALDVLLSWAQRCAAAQRKLRQALAQPWLIEVRSLTSLPGPTHLMQRDPRYRRLYTLFRRLRSAPFIAFNSPALWLPIENLPQLYEQWCVLQVVKALLPLGQITTQDVAAQHDSDERGPTTERRWTLRLRQNAPLLTLRCADGTEIALWYQRRYQPQAPTSTKLGALDPFVRIPDIALEISRPDSPPQVLVFDAKYRVAPDGRVPQDALDDAYAYRSAIGVAGTRATIGAFLLFPGSEPLNTAEQVGALPLLPDQTAALGALIEQALATLH